MVARDNVEPKTEMGGSDDDLWEEGSEVLQSRVVKEVRS